jgi:hypothetical protein
VRAKLGMINDAVLSAWHVDCLAVDLRLLVASASVDRSGWAWSDP